MAVPLPVVLLLIISSLLSPAAATARAIAARAAAARATAQTAAPSPAPWPEQFHSVLLMNYSNELSLVDLWYDWPGGRNFNILRRQLGADGPPFFDLEWNNGTSFFYTLQAPRSCRSAQLDVGILRPDWLRGALYLGRASVDGFLCDAWAKADFITYYQDVRTLRPVKWVFYTGMYAAYNAMLCCVCIPCGPSFALQLN